MQSEQQKSSSSPTTEPAKKNYHKPQVVIYGGVGELTKNVGAQGNPDGAESGHMKTR